MTSTLPSQIPMIQRFQNVIYFYDLPKSYTSVALASLIKSKSGIEVQQPQVRRDPNKPFYTVCIKIDAHDQFEKVKQDFRYFEYDGKPCRALPYCQDLVGVNIPKLMNQNLFIRKIPKKDFGSAELENQYSKFGKIISCKVSLGENHDSRGYGFVCFENPESASNALNQHQESENLIPVKFQPKNRGDQRKLFNNIYVKNLPIDVTDEDIKKLFGPYGNISSLFQGPKMTEPMTKPIQEPIQKFYFICFNDPDNNSQEYGPRCAAKAVEELNGKEYKGQNLHVVPALKKQDRYKELQHATLNYKTSKKRCNLYVKGFYSENEDQLRSVFNTFGEIESCRIFEAKDGKTPYAFVCFKTPDQASAAKQCQNLMINSKPLQVNYYEIKQYRDLKNEDTKDKQDFIRYTSENGGQGAFNQDQITTIIKQLMASMTNVQSQTPPQGGYNQGGQQGYQNRGVPQQYGNREGNQQRQGGGYGQQRGGYHQSQSQRNFPNQQVQQPVVGGRQAQMPPVAIQLPTQGIINPIFAPQVSNVFQSNHPSSQKFYTVTLPILGAVNEMNPQYKQTVGGAIFEFVQQQVQNYAPKVTGMLIDLPVLEIQKYMVNFDLFLQRVSQATQLLEQQTVAAQQ